LGEYVKKSFKYISAFFTVLTLASALFISNGCSKSQDVGFAIYLTRDDIPPTQLPLLNHVDIEEKPIIDIGDIVKYDANIHAITLTSNAYERIANLEVPVQGRSFLVCVNKQVIYSGAFWTPISSYAYSGITIWKPLIPRDTNIIKLELGYPPSSFYKDEDLRNDPRVIQSLKQDGKLVQINQK
jgi:hypothetical protein